MIDDKVSGSRNVDLKKDGYIKILKTYTALRAKMNNRRIQRMQ